jgi:hypothetical protein
MTDACLSYYRARYYDPGAGRFLSEDPAGFVVATNLYVYVKNIPTRLGDPSGLFELDISETWSRSGEPWWDPTEWGRDHTAVSTKLNVHCVQVGCGWQPRIKLSVHFAVTHDHDLYAYFHEKEHVEAMKYFFKKSEPYFGFLERKTYKTKEVCEAAAKHQAQQMLDLVWEAMSDPNNRVDWLDRLRFFF